MYALFYLIAMTLAVNQGSVALVTLPEEPGVKSMELRWGDRRVPFVQIQNKWETVVGVDLDTKAGDHEAEIDVTFNDGRTDKLPVVFRVVSVKFPTTELSLDHVTPRSQGGQSTWENIVCACVSCNVRKGGRTPKQAHLSLIRKPEKPKRSPLLNLKLTHKKYQSWKTFLDNAYWSVELK